MGLTRTVAPAPGPVTVAELKAHLRVLSSREDEVLATYLEAAVGRLDGARGMLNRCLLEQTWEWTLDCFPPSELGLALPLDPLVSVQEVRYLGMDGASLVWDPLEYTVDTKNEPGWIAPIYGGSWPSARDVFNAITVTFVAGYATPAAVPARIRIALMGLAAQLYEYRDAPGDPASWVRDYLVDYRVMR